MHPGSVRQTQSLDPFNRDGRCYRWLREGRHAKKTVKRWVIFTFYV